MDQTFETRAVASSPREPNLPLLEPGTRVDQYNILRRLGGGGMGDLYLARDTTLGRRAALKIVRLEKTSVDRFLFEARTTAKFSHPNIVTVYGVGEVVVQQRRAPYLALEYVEGESLDVRMRNRYIALPDALRIALAIAEGLAEAHRNEVVHGDLKPANVVIGDDGRVRVVDFGLAQVTSQDGEDADVSDQARGGTPAYMAPEQWMSLSSTAPTDVWALGVVLFELCCGKRPFDYSLHTTTAEAPSTGPEAMALQGMVVCSADPAPKLATMATVPPALDDLVARCLEKARSDRPSMETIVDALRELIGLQTRGASVEASEPFRGLSSFTERDAGLFFGRDREIDAIVEKLGRQPIVPIIGPSGVGKSSLVQAGVVPRLREANPWLVLSLRPGPRPFQNLAAALARALAEATSSRELAGDRHERQEPDDHELAARLAGAPQSLCLELRALAEQRKASVLLFIDQLEELFTMVADEAERTRFVEALAEAVDDASEPVRIVFTLRDDFLGRLAMIRASGAMVAHIYVVQPLGDERLVEVARRPVEALGYRFEDSQLLTDLVRPLRNVPAALPLLQFAGRLLWDERDREEKLLLRSSYESIGGVEGALARHADGVIDELTPESAAIARQVLLRLVSSEKTKLVLSRGEVVEGLVGNAHAAVEQVLTKLIDARLLIVTKRRGGPTAQALVELAHESLTRTWATLARWIDESRDELAFINDTRQAADLWIKRGKRREELWVGDALAEAQRMLRRCAAGHAAVPSVVREFIAASESRARARKRRRNLAIAAALGLTTAIALTAIAMALRIADKEREARRERDRAKERELEADRRRAFGLVESARAAMKERAPLEARAKIRMALQIEDIAAARVLWTQLEREPLSWSKNLGVMIYDVEYSPDGKTIAAAASDVLYLLDAETGNARPLRGKRDQYLDLAFSPDSKRLMTGGWQGEVRLWDLANDGASRALGKHPAKVWGGTFLPDGRFASMSSDGALRLWSAAGEELRTLRAGPKGHFVAVSRDGRWLAANDGATIIVWEGSDTKEAARWQAHDGDVGGLSFLAKRNVLVSVGADGRIRSWDVGTWRRRDDLAAAASPLRGMAVSADGQRIAAVARPSTTLVFDGELQRTVSSLDYGAEVRAVHFRPNSHELVTAGTDGVARVLDVDTPSGLHDSGAGHDGRVHAVAVSSDGRRVASAGPDKTIRIWDGESGRRLSVLHVEGDWLRQIGFTADGKYLAAPAGQNTVALWDVERGRVVRAIGVADQPSHVVPSADGKLVAIITHHQRFLSVWDWQRGETITSTLGFNANGVAWHPDAEHVVVSKEAALVTWNVKTGKREREVACPFAFRVAYHPKGDFVASSGIDGKVSLWNGRDAPTVLAQHGTRLYGIEVHPDGERIATASADGGVYIWHLRSGKHEVLRGHRHEANFVAINLDGRFLVSSSDDGSVRMWDLVTMRPRWRATALLPDRNAGAPWLASHRGWTRLGAGDPQAKPPWIGARLAEAIAAARRVSVAEDRACIESHDGAALWSIAEDRSLATSAIAVSDVLAFPWGCAALAGGRVMFLLPDGARDTEVKQATTIGRASSGVLATSDTHIHWLGQQGRAMATHPIAPRVSAVAAADSMGPLGSVLVGYADGSVELGILGQAPSLTLRDTPSAAALRIERGPRSTVAVGYANGVVGLWELVGGAKLWQHRLHGAVDYLHIGERALSAASELGDSVTWDLGALVSGHCDLLRTVWADVPVEWESERLVPRAPPSDHPCRK